MTAFCGDRGYWQQRADVVVIGTGVAGLVAALTAHRGGQKVVVLSKAGETATFYAQGGIAVVLPHPLSEDGDSIDQHIADTLTAGAFAVQEAPFLHLVAVETSEPDGEGSLFVTLARRAAEAGGLAVVRTGERGQLATRFGALDTVDATLVDAESRRACTAFRLNASLATLRLEGWLCAPLGQLPEPQAVACTVDRLSPLPGAPLSPVVAAMLAQPRAAACPPEEPATTAAVPAPRRPVRKNAARVRHSRPASP